MEKTLLNLIPGACSPEVHLSQYDKGRAVPFKLAEGKSAYSVPDGSEIVVQATKPSGLGFVVPVTFDGDTATMTITETMSNEYGRFPAELSITNNGNRIGTANFVMNIERSPHPEGTINGDAESLLPELTLLVERIEAAADSVDEDTQTVTEAKAEVLQAKADTLQAKADTLSARDDALQAKADAITAKESAEASAQAAAEASERAEELIGSVSTKADAIVKTASGEIASFSDGGDDLPMKSLKVNIVPKQSGSGEPSPSNVRPISGTDTVNVFVRNSNLFSVSESVWGEIIASSNGAFASNSSAWRSGYIPAKPDTEYKLSGLENTVYSLVAYYDSNKNFISRSSGALRRDITFTTPTNCYYIAFTQYGTTETPAPTDKRNEIRLCFTKDNSLPYEPYQGTSYPISLGQTVYGGTLEVMSGKLTINMAYVDLGSLTWRKGNASAGHWRFGATFNAKSPTASNKKPNAICSKYPTVTPDDTWLGRMGITVNSANHDLLVVDENYSDADTFKASLNGVQFVYELITPIEVTLTPTQVKTLLGNNNIWADSGSVEVEYRADTTLAYNELLSLIASL